VVSREVTLLRHWDWLAAQPGGASVALRKLVEDARRTRGGRSAARCAGARVPLHVGARGRSCRASRRPCALYANDLARMGELIAGWPADVSAHALALARGDLPPSADEG
jgi:hypothetical protein